MNDKIHYNCDKCQNYEECTFYLNLVVCKNNSIYCIPDAKMNVYDFYCRNYKKGGEK